MSQQPAQKELIDENCQIDHDSIAWTRNPTREQLHRIRAYYLANVTMIDEKIGQILEALEEKGYLENAIVIFTSDHGDCLGDHGHIEKWTMYDIITRTPLIVRAPGHFEGGRQIDDLCQQMDIAPVILEMAGADVPDSWEAVSVMPLLRGESNETLRQYVFAEQGRDLTLTGTEMMTMIRSRDWKLVHYIEGGHGELYDMGNDPGERNNLWANPAYEDRKLELLDALLNWRMRSGLKTASWTIPWR